MKMNKNVMLGAGLVLGGIILAMRAKKQGKVVPFIGGMIPSKPVPVPPAPKSDFSGAAGARSNGETVINCGKLIYRGRPINQFGQWCSSKDGKRGVWIPA
jgi:hypothetical protein